MEKFQSFFVKTLLLFSLAIIGTQASGFNATSKSTLVEKSFKYYDVPDSKMDQYQLQVQVSVSGGIQGADGNTQALYFVFPAGYGVNIIQKYTTQMLSKSEKLILNYTNKNTLCEDCPQTYCESCADAFGRIMPIDNGFGNNIENRILKFEPLTSDTYIEDVSGNGRRVSKWLVTITFDADESFRLAPRKLYITGMEQEDVKEIQLTEFETSFLPHGNLEAIDIVESFYGTNVVGGESHWKYVYGLDLEKAIKVSSLISAEMMSFEGIQDDGNTILSWNTGNECKNEKFVVERSKDGINYDKIGEIKGCDNMIEKREYAFVDFNGFDGNSYYRIYVKDQDDTKFYTNTIKVNPGSSQVAKIDAKVKNEKLEWNAIASGENQGKVSIAIFDKEGKIVKTLDPDAIGSHKNVLNLETYRNNGYLALFKYQKMYKAVKMLEE
ncbi:MAG: hypothetical protein IPQ18_12750 [Saprospiraceae bacterium]|jgi:hypothetical protein|nr:hypothetical protein [Saprospiraceae bacterium]